MENGSPGSPVTLRPMIAIAIPEYKQFQKGYGKVRSPDSLISHACIRMDDGAFVSKRRSESRLARQQGESVSSFGKDKPGYSRIDWWPAPFHPTDHHGPMWWKVYRWNDTKKALVSSSAWFKLEPSEIVK